MNARILSLRELNRATLARQLLLGRATLSPLRAIERLSRLQGENPSSPYISLWSRPQSFELDHLARAIEERWVVRVTLMRGTLHLMTTRDYLIVRSALQPDIEGRGSTCDETE